MLVAESSIPKVIRQSNVTSQNFNDWCFYDGLTVDVSKTHYMRFLPRNASIDSSFLIKAHGVIIAAADTFKLLGTTLDPKLSWEEHISLLACKLSMAAFAFRYLRDVVSLGVLNLM
ncbi:hypothetical protein HHI36_011159 [Cryptolaemus montrouzieri]|uniref:Uncharacterized protein n=1 Tax=Cryptolaemus montrouzieri TaxID=559131 RepID=A0ABD2MLS0_9CUCU